MYSGCLTFHSSSLDAKKVKTTDSLSNVHPCLFVFGGSGVDEQTK